MPENPDPVTQKRAGRRKLLLLFLVCLAPVVASYLTYYVIHPQMRSNYGELIEPQRPLPAIKLTQPNGDSFNTADLLGKWTLVTVQSGACDQHCTDKLFMLRQVRIMTGRERERVARLWLIPDNVPLPTIVMREYEGTIMLRIDPNDLARWLPADGGDTPAAHLYLIDPHGHLMMRFPTNPDPLKVKADLVKLLMASSIG
jgi:hypothetical protein